jgi:hypothetical protein
VRIAEMEGVLKQQMLDKGMTAEQIELVMHAGHRIYVRCPDTVRAGRPMPRRR